MRASWLNPSEDISSLKACILSDDEIERLVDLLASCPSGRDYPIDPKICGKLQSFQKWKGVNP